MSTVLILTNSNILITLYNNTCTVCALVKTTMEIVKLSVQHEKHLYSVRYLPVKLGLGLSCYSARIFENASTALYNGYEVIVLLLQKLKILLIIVEQGNKLISSL